MTGKATYLTCTVAECEDPRSLAQISPAQVTQALSTKWLSFHNELKFFIPTTWGLRQKEPRF